VVEIDAGDTFAYDTVNVETQHAREVKAAERLFGLLPTQQGSELLALWHEFEERQTPESKYANALDRLQPLLQNYYSGGQSWIKHGVTREQVIQRMRAVQIGMPGFWPVVSEIISKAVEKGMIKA